MNFELFDFSVADIGTKPLRSGLKEFALQEGSDSKIAKAFLKASLPQGLESHLRTYVTKTLTPLAVRSSSLLEDARYQAYAGLYNTYMLPNDHPDPEQRLNHLLQAVKLVYASTYFEAPKSFSKRVGHSVHQEKMAVPAHRSFRPKAICWAESL
jgi:phosphoenolpyruvate synthase/pyruvate phosphate dikinase